MNKSFSYFIVPAAFRLPVGVDLFQGLIYTQVTCHCNHLLFRTPKTSDHKWPRPVAPLRYIWNRLNSRDINIYTHISLGWWSDLAGLSEAWEASCRFSVLTALHGRLSVCVCVLKEKKVNKPIPFVVHFLGSPGTASALFTELPSGGLSPTMLGSWALGGGGKTGGLGPCSCSNFFGTTNGKKTGETEKEMLKKKGQNMNKTLTSMATANCG